MTTGRTIRTIVALGILAVAVAGLPSDAGAQFNRVTFLFVKPEVSDEAIENRAEALASSAIDGVVIGGGLEETSEKMLRIAHMGFTSDEMYVLKTISALEKTLQKLGYDLKRGEGMEAAMKVFERPKI